MPKTVVVLGGSGLVGSHVRELWSQSFDIVAPTHAELDVLNQSQVADLLRASGARTVVNLAAWTDVDGAEAERGDVDGRVYGLNAAFPRHLAETCAALDTHLIHVSTDYVFDGTRTDRAYRESDRPGPALSWYAETKLFGEEAVLRSDAPVTVARFEMPFTARDHPRRDLARTTLNRLRSAQPILGVTDQRITPVFLDDAVHALRLLVEQPYMGVIHVAAADWTTPYELARGIARRLGLDASLIEPADYASFVATRPARRPQHSWLDVSLFGRLYGTHVLRTVDAELDIWSRQLQAAPV